MVDVSKVSFFRPTARLDERTFEAIFDEYYPKVYAVLFRMTGDRPTADDLTAETFWRLWERPPANSENLGGWLYRVATRLGYNALRDSRRREQYETTAVETEAWSSPPIDPSQAVERRIERQRVRAVLRRMSYREVQVLVMRHSGLTYKEIAAAASVAASSVGTLLSRAEARFEALYRQGDEDAPER